MEPSPANPAAKTRVPGSVVAIRVLLWVQASLIGVVSAIVGVLVLFLSTLGAADASTGTSSWRIILLTVLATIAVLGTSVTVAIIGFKRRPSARYVIVAWEVLMVLAAVGLGAAALLTAGSAASGWSIATTNLGTQLPSIDLVSLFWPVVWLAMASTALIFAIGPGASLYYGADASTSPPG